MSSATLVRLGGLAALAGGLLITITALVGLVALDYENFDETARTGAYAATSLLCLLAVILVLGGLVALYAGQLQAAGSPGFLGSSWPSLVLRCLSALSGFKLSQRRPWR